MATGVRPTETRWRASRRSRLFVMAAAALFTLFLINWIAVSVHIANLHRQATAELRSGGNADDAVGRNSDAAGFEGARTAFEILTFSAAAFAVGGVAYSTRRDRPRQA